MDDRWGALARELADLGLWADLPHGAAADQMRALTRGQPLVTLDVMDAVTLRADGWTWRGRGRGAAEGHGPGAEPSRAGPHRRDHPGATVR